MSGPGCYSRRSPFVTGLACKCPRCGQGRLFAGYLTVVERCADCGLDLKKSDSGDGPAVFIIFVLGALIVPAALWVESRFAPPMWLHVAIWPPVILGASLGLLRPMKALVIALQYRHRGRESGAIDGDAER